VILASPTAVTGFMQQVTVDMPIKVFTIGPSTSAAARAAGLTVTAEARSPSLEGILEAMRWQT
jgi:uroporphyrinogen-III synthase